MNSLNTLLGYFPTGTAEGDRQFLNRAFITPKQLISILEIPPGSPRILAGNKGVGKTAVLEWLFSAARKQKIPVLLIRPDDLDTSPISGATDIGSIKRGMFDCLLSAVSTLIGIRLRGFLRGPAELLYNEAVASGKREPDWAGKLLGVLSKISKPVTRIDGEKLARDLSRGTMTSFLAEAVKDYLLLEKSLFFLLIDDTDQVASFDDPQHLNRIWGLLLAVRKLTQTSPNIRAIVSLRTEVWMRLTRSDQGQRDQVDHIRPLVAIMRAPDNYMREIFMRRIFLAARDLGKRSYPILEFFESERMSLPTSTETRNWETFILKSARERPRDMIQLVAHLARVAKDRGGTRITEGDAQTAMRDYSKERAEDLAVEFCQECPPFLDVIRTFANIDFEVGFEQLRLHLRSVPSHFSVKMRQITLQPDNDDHVIELLRLLHEAGFLNPRISDSRYDRNFRHVTFLDDPHFVERSRWNELQSAHWEVHPAFRTYLLSLKEDKKWRTH